MKDVIFNLVAGCIAVAAVSTIMVGITDTANGKCNAWVHSQADCAVIEQKISD